jgi:hypothetical protein
MHSPSDHGHKIRYLHLYFAVNQQGHAQQSRTMLVISNVTLVLKYVQKK